MEYVRLGRSNLKISRLGLGAMAFGSRRWRDWILEEGETKPIVDRALDLGINFFDTSDYYSGGESEAVLGRCLLSRVAREQVVIATKAGNPMGPSVTERGYSRKHLVHAVHASLKRLGTDYVDLYQTHIWDHGTDLEEMVAAFDDLVRAGKILHAGITTMPAWQLARCLGIARETGRRPFVSAQNHYNLVHREDEREFIPLCRSEGVALIPYSPLARGFLCGGRVEGGGPTRRARTDEFNQKSPTRLRWRGATPRGEGGAPKHPVSGPAGPALYPRPCQTPYPPLWQVVDSPSSIEFAAKNDLGIIMWRPPVEALRERCRLYRDSAGSVGVDLPFGARTGVSRDVYIAESREEARRIAGKWVMDALNFSNWRGPRIFLRPGETFEPGQEAALKKELPFEFVDERSLIFGPPEYAVEKFTELRDDLNLEQVNMKSGWPGMGQRDILRSLERFAERVLPELRRGGTAAPAPVEAAGAAA